jgi:hypothetical protein
MDAEFVLWDNEKIKKDINVRWRKYFIDFNLTNSIHSKIKVHLNWASPIPFNKGNRTKIPKLPGIYLFFVKPTSRIHEEQSFILYVGYSMNLYNRYGDYLYKYSNSDEPNYIERRIMLNSWSDYLYYTYIDLNGKTESEITKIESDIIDSLVPPINRDFAHAVIKEQVRLNRLK